MYARPARRERLPLQHRYSFGNRPTDGAFQAKTMSLGKKCFRSPDPLGGNDPFLPNRPRLGDRPVDVRYP